MSAEDLVSGRLHPDAGHPVPDHPRSRGPDSKSARDFLLCRSWRCSLLPVGRTSVSSRPSGTRWNDLRWAIDVGDIFWRPCTDERYRQTLNEFNGLRHPVIYTPGDNEWTDCWEPGSGGFLPLDRLNRIRQIFFQNPTRSMGRVPCRWSARLMAGPSASSSRTRAGPTKE